MSCCSKETSKKINDVNASESCCGGASSCSCDNIPGHKMCQLAQPSNGFDVEKVKSLTNDAKYVCSCCGRTANNKVDLYSPVNLF